jgi:hypothetical protein
MICQGEAIMGNRSSAIPINDWYNTRAWRKLSRVQRKRSRVRGVFADLLRLQSSGTPTRTRKIAGETESLKAGRASRRQSKAASAL